MAMVKKIKAFTASEHKDFHDKGVYTGHDTQVFDLSI